MSRRGKTARNARAAIEDSEDDASVVLNSSEDEDFEQETFSSQPSARKRRRKIRRYDSDYIKFGFVSTGDDEKPRGLCVICLTTLSNSSLAPAKLRRHLETKHPELASSPPSFFEIAAGNLAQSREKLLTDSLRRFEETSVRISHKIGKAGEAHTIGEELVKPCMIEAARCLFSDEQMEAIEAIPLSNSTISRRIADISSWLERCVCDELRQSPCWALQIDESTDVAGLAILLAFVRYTHQNEVKEELLFCKALPGNTTGEAIFNLVNGYLEEHDLSWSTCVDLCTDGAAAMTGRQKGFVSRVRERSFHIRSSHCIIHREALAVKRIPQKLGSVLNDAIKVVNYIKMRPLQSRMFKILCDEMGSSHSCLLLHTEIRWLSRGRVLTRLFELRDEIVAFSIGTQSSLFDGFRDPTWLQRLAYLADIFQKLNELNIGLQGRRVDIFSATEKINATKRMLENWAKAIPANHLDSFLTLYDILNEWNLTLDENVRMDLVQHLIQLRENLELYFPTSSLAHLSYLEWVKYPFSVGYQSSLSSLQNDQLAELQQSSHFRESFATNLPVEFWASACEIFPELSRSVLRALVPFVSTYLCEAGFSIYTSTKNKYRNRLDAENDMRLQLSTRNPDFAEISKSIQYQRSH